jgi:hypothetical protein
MVGVPTGTMPRTSCVYNTGRGSLPLESIVLYSGAEREGRPQHQREGGQGHGTRRVHAADGKGRLNFPDANGICGQCLRPPIEEAIKRLCNQFA